MMQELSLNLLDIAQNSVKANATLIGIDIDEDDKADRLRFAVRDNGCGMSDEVLRRVTDPFYTTRTTRRVGLGVPFIKMACEMTGGCFSIESAPGAGTMLCAEMGYHHIDRSPIGDIASTVASLIQCNPDIDFVYTHRTAHGSFAADTREFRAVLEDVPLSSPEVVAFIRSYIEEHLQEIQGGEI